MELANKKLAEELTRQSRSKNERLKEELSGKIEVQNLNESFNKLKKDTEIKSINIQKSVESGLERV
jgi:hypothetical protein